MWITFLACCMALLALLYIPGTVIAKVVGLQGPEAVAVAPLVSVALFAVLGIVMGLLGLKGVQPVLYSALLLIVVFVLLVAVRGKRGIQLKGEGLSCSYVVELGVSVLVCSVVMAALFLRNIDGADSFLEFADNVFHLNVIEAMLNGGSLSILHVTQYSGMESPAQTPYSMDGGFYPAGWHILVAMSCYMSSASATIGENAGAFTFAAIVFPVGVSVLLKSVFPDRKGIAAVGSFAYCACAAFPLAPLDVHQIYPNFAAMCALPGLVAFFALRMRKIGSVPDLLKTAVLLIVPLLGCAVFHPNVFIAFFVAVYSFLLVYPWSGIFSGERRVACVLIPVAVSVVFVIGWVAIANTPIFSGVTSFLWEWTISPSEALFSAISFGLVLRIPQFVFALFAVIGFVACLKRPNSRWLSLSLALFLLIYFFNACGDPEMKRLFAGYWYTDAERTAALAALMAVPCAAVGLYSFALAAYRAVCGVIAGKVPARVLLPSVAGVVVFVFCLVAYMPYLPFSSSPTALGYRMNELRSSSVVAYRAFFTSAEKAFCDEAKAVVGDDLVLNMPQDGSQFAYSVCGLNVYYKGYVDDNDSSESKLIRGNLSNIGSNKEIEQLVEASAAKYVIVLDRGDLSKADSVIWGTPGDPGWEGFRDLDDNSSFKLILEDGCLKLYEIELH